MIIYVGYRVNSKTATNFRKWATQTLKQYITEGRMSSGAFAKSFGSDSDIVIKYAEEYKKQYLEWVKYYKGLNGKIVEHYAPELVVLVREKRKF